jgi:hypothetical protein
MRNAWIRAVCAAWLPIGAVHAAELPLTQEGLWDVRVRTTIAPMKKLTVKTYRLCRDQASERAANELYQNVRGCTVATSATGAGKFSVVTRCATPASVILTRAALTYRGATARHAESKTTYTPPIEGKTQATSLEDQKYVGACPADMKPGDRLGADGKVQPRK